MRCSRWTAAMVPAALVLLAALTPPAQAQPAKLLITQVEVRGGPPSTNLGEYVVIRNPGATAVDLGNYYLTDATRPSNSQYYYNLPDESKVIGGGVANDFVARFPAGAMLGAGQEISVAVNGSIGFQARYGLNPNYELYEDDPSPDGVPDMREARPGSVVDNVAQLPSLSNAGEVVILFHWDGTTNLVTDVDYFVWGDKEEAVDKTGVTITRTGSPSGSTYLADTPIATQDGQIESPTATFIRTSQTEGTQVATGGNGVGGRNETSENLSATFGSTTEGVPPGMQPVDTTPPTLVSATGAAGNTNVDLLFSEALGAGAGTASNYEVYPTGNQAGAITVTAAETGGDPTTVTLELASALAAGTSYTVEVSNVQDTAGNAIAPGSTRTFTTGGAATFGVAGVFQFGPRQIGVAFTQKVNTTTATVAGNYTVTSTPAVTVSSVAMQDNGQTAILTTAANLPLGTALNVTVQNVTGAGGDPLTANGPFPTTTAAQQVTGIADIHANIGTVDGQTVTIVGQIFIPVTQQGAHISGWIQDGTGKGLNLFFLNTTNIPASVGELGRVAVCTGEVDLFSGSVIELLNFTAAGVAQGMPHLGPKVLSVAEAGSREWEGTYIQTTSTLTAPPSASGASNTNAPADGITFRIRNNTGINFSQFQTGDTVTGAGAGADFQGTPQIQVGNAADFVKGGGGPDTTPPTLTSASGEGTSVQVTFSETVAGGAATAANYTVYPTASPSQTVAVTSASVNARVVTLTLASALAPTTSYTVRVSNVQDAAGNAVAANSTVVFVSGGTPTDFVVMRAFPFGPREIGVAFSRAVNVGQATNPANYQIAPQGGAAAVTIQSIEVQDNQQTAIIHTAAALPRSATYQVTVSNVTSSTGAALVSGGPATVATGAQTVTGISTIHQNIGTLDGQVVTIEGQVFIPVTQQGSHISGWIQDGTGKGMNLFILNTTNIPAAVSDMGRVARCTGTVDLFSGSVIELLNFTATPIAEGMPSLKPKVLTVAQAGSREWEGTYIQTTSTITSAPAASGADNHNVAAQGITFRVRNNTGINFSQFQVGDTVTGAGAGADFQGAPQIQVGNAADFVKGGGGPDTTPPALVSATGEDTRVVVSFSEPVGAGGSTAANYRVFRADNPGSTVAVSAATANGAAATLTLASALVGNVTYTVEVSNVQDAAGNVIAAASRVNFTAGGEPADLAITGAFQFGSRHVGIGFTKKVDPAQAVVPANYAFSPPLTLASVEVQDNGQTVILRAAADLPRSTAYTVTVTGVTADADGGGIVGSNQAAFTTSSQTVTDIAAIMADTSGFSGTTVTVMAQVYIPTGSRGGTPSGYIQDGSGRGINLFGTGSSAATNNRGNVLQITGMVTVFFTTPEIERYTATLVASGQPQLGARKLSVAEANSFDWEGTYIEVTATITEIASTSATAVNFNAQDDRGQNFITFRRAGTGLPIDPADYAVGDRVTGRGAGGNFQSTFQIMLGNLEDFFLAPQDTTVIPGGDGATITVAARTFLKGYDTEFPITLTGPSGADAVCRVFDLQGRLVKVLLDGSFLGKQIVFWDGRDEEFELVPAGMYICHFELLDGGSKSTDKAPIVVSTRLD